MNDQHTAKAFDSDLQDLSRMVAEMGGLAEKQVADSVSALARRDTVLAGRITAADAQIDALQSEIEEKSVLTIARRQPMAIDLRESGGALRRANDLERMGDHATNIAETVHDIIEGRPITEQRPKGDTTTSAALVAGDR